MLYETRVARAPVKVEANDKVRALIEKRTIRRKSESEKGDRTRYA
jgi:RecJ-like exonuclease